MTNTFRLGDIAEVFNGKTPAKSEQRSEGYPVLKIRDVDEDGAHRGAFGSYVDGQLAQKYRSKWIVPGDTLILNAAHNADYVGSKTFLAGDSVANALPTGEWLIVRPRERASAAYLNFWLRSGQTRDRIRFAVKGIHLYPKDVAALEISLPPLEEQHRIVDLLSRAEGIVRLRREAQRKAAELLPVLFLDMFGDPASNPKRWPVVAFADMADTQLGKMLDKKKQTGLHAFPYLGNSNVRWDDFDLDGLLEMDFSEQERVKFQLMSGDLLACEGGEVGRAAIWRGQMDGCFFQKAIHRIRPKPSSAVPEFILHWLWNMSKQGLLANAGAKATIAHLPAEKLRSLIVALPPIELQRLFANKVEAVRAIAARQATALATAQATFDALLQQAFAARQPG